MTEAYLATADERYRLTRMTEKWLLADYELNVGPWPTFANNLVFPFLERELKTATGDGEPSQSIYEWFDEESGRWETAQDGFRATASLLVDDVTKAVTFPDGAERLIDIGGGDVLYAMELCRRYPDLSARACLDA